MPKLETKSAVILLSTFILGIALGLVSSQYLIRHRLEPLRHRGNVPGVGLWLERAVNPSGEQKEILESIVSDYERRIRNLRKRHMDDNRSLLDSLMLEVRPHLTEAQIRDFERLRKGREERRMMEYKRRVIREEKRHKMEKRIRDSD